MGKKGILVDMYYCTGCHACEVACKQENQFPVGIAGIKINELIMENGLNTDRCADRISSGEDTRPACCKHCGTASLHYGELTELVKMMETMPRSVLHSPL